MNAVAVVAFVASTVLLVSCWLAVSALRRVRRRPTFGVALLAFYALAALGGWLWLALMYQRSVWAGIAQTLLVVPVFWDDVEKRLELHRRAHRAPAAGDSSVNA